MLKTYEGKTFTSTDFANDWDLKNSYGNVFRNCTFEGPFVEVNFTRATFYPNCDFNNVTFRRCNFTDVNPGSSSVDVPVDEATTLEANNISTVIPEALEHGKTDDERVSFEEQKRTVKHNPLT